MEITTIRRPFSSTATAPAPMNKNPCGGGAGAVRVRLRRRIVNSTVHYFHNGLCKKLSFNKLTCTVKILSLIHDRNYLYGLDQSILSKFSSLYFYIVVKIFLLNVVKLFLHSYQNFYHLLLFNQ